MEELVVFKGFCITPIEKILVFKAWRHAEKKPLNWTSKDLITGNMLIWDSQSTT